MEKITYTRKHGAYTTLAIAGVTSMFALTLIFTQSASAASFNQITAQADLGMTNANVTNIQTYLASNSSFYPQGLVTGYYGQLTKAAVERFQTYYGIVSSGSPSTTGYGRVGPSTMDKMNALIAGTTGGPVSQGDVSGPQLYAVNQTVSSNTVTFSWNTNENASARIFYDTTPVQFNEGEMDSSGFGARTGQIASTDSNLRMNHTISLTGLTPNTRYYYTLVSTDGTGNVSVYGPNNVVVTQ